MTLIPQFIGRRSFLAGLVASGVGQVFNSRAANSAANQHSRGARVPKNFGARIITQDRLSMLTENAIESNQQLQDLFGSSISSIQISSGLPPRFDWRERDRVTPVRDQSSCGSCWIFGALGAFESAYLIANPRVKSDSFEVSEQEILDCSFAETNCFAGGFHDVPFTYLLNFGAVDNDQYTYSVSAPARSNYCNSNFGSRPYQARNWNYISNNAVIPPVNDIKKVILSKGPVVAGVNATSSWDDYNGGVIDGPHSDGKEENVNHEVLIVGWDDTLKGQNFPAGSWIVKNSWGKSWGNGEKGFVKIPYGASNIGFGASWITAWPLIAGAAAASLQNHLRELNILNATIPVQ